MKNKLVLALFTLGMFMSFIGGTEKSYASGIELSDKVELQLHSAEELIEEELSTLAAPPEFIAESVLKSYYQNYSAANGSYWKDRYVYGEIRFANGYTVSESTEEMATFAQKLLGLSHVKHTFTYYTY